MEETLKEKFERWYKDAKVRYSTLIRKKEGLEIAFTDAYIMALNENVGRHKFTQEEINDIIKMCEETIRRYQEPKEEV